MSKRSLAARSDRRFWFKCLIIAVLLTIAMM